MYFPAGPLEVSTGLLAAPKLCRIVGPQNPAQPTSAQRTDVLGKHLGLLLPRRRSCRLQLGDHLRSVAMGGPFLQEGGHHQLGSLVTTERMADIVSAVGS